MTAPRGVGQCSVVWIDMDNGRAVTHRRFSALAKARGLSDAPVTVYSFPPLDLCDANKVLDFRDILLEANAGLVFIDTLLNAATVSSENDSAQMRVPMFALRQLVEQTGATIVAIHHTSKNGSTSGHGDLRGSSAIVGAIDSAFRVVRPDIHQGEITITPTKTRNAPVEPFAGRWDFSHDQHGELEIGRFYGVDCGQHATQGQQDLRKKILDAIGDGQLGVNKLLKNMGGSKPRLSACLHEMEGDGELVSTPGPNNSILYSRPEG